ncbi:MAG: hypothetical protein EOP34_01425 [Rickettsiales bacterium]|nr:MAG: hypothetical protein EOP34_01425 [Rickettsiales bacterium]
MPQLYPYTLSMQWSSTLICLLLITVLLALYVLPSIVRVTLTRAAIFGF